MRIPPARWVAIVGTACISFSGIFVALAAVSPITSAFFRVAYAVPVLLAIGWFTRDADARSKRLRWGAFAAGAILAADLFFFHSAIEQIGAGLGTVTAHTQVVFVGAMSWLLYRHLPTRRTVVFGAVIFLGVALLSGLGREDAFGDDPLLGVIYGVMSGALYAGFLMALQASNPAGLAPAVRVLTDASLGTMAGAAVIGLITGDLALTPSWPSHGWLLALALLIQLAGWAFLTYALPRLPALTVSVIILGQPMLAVLWGWLILDERLSSIQAVGVVLVAIGLVAVNAQSALVREPVTAAA